MNPFSMKCHLSFSYGGHHKGNIMENLISTPYNSIFNRDSPFIIHLQPMCKTLTNLSDQCAMVFRYMGPMWYGRPSHAMGIPK